MRKKSKFNHELRKPKKMERFPARMPDFEKVFGSDSFLGKLRYDNIKTPEGFDSLDTYAKLMRKEIKESNDETWMQFVRYEWLARKFRYKSNRTGVVVKRRYSSIAFLAFLRKYGKIDNGLFEDNIYFSKMVSYFDELYPEFDQRNPYVDPDYYQFPWDNLLIEIMFLVVFMDERIDLLHHLNSLNLDMIEVYDYAINYIGKCNELAGYTKFEFVRLSKLPFYIRVNEDKPE